MDVLRTTIISSCSACGDLIGSMHKTVEKVRQAGREKVRDGDMVCFRAANRHLSRIGLALRKGYAGRCAFPDRVVCDALMHTARPNHTLSLL